MVVCMVCVVCGVWGVRGGHIHTAVCYSASNTPVRGARSSTRAAQPVAVNCGALQRLKAIDGSFADTYGSFAEM